MTLTNQRLNEQLRKEKNMIIRAIEYAELSLVAVIIARFFLAVTNNEDKSVWKRTEETAKRALNILVFSKKEK